MINGKGGLVLCTSGSREILIDGWLHKIGKGTVCIVSPMIPLIEVCRDADYAELPILADFDVIYPVVKSAISRELIMKVRNNPFMQLDAGAVDRFVGKKAAIDRLLNDLTELKSAGGVKIVEQLINVKVQETVLEFMYMFYKYRVDVASKNYRKVDIVVSRFVFIVNQCFSEKRSVEYYARQLNISTSHLTRLVKKSIGRTPSEWIASVTVVNAKQLLLQTEMSIKEIAATLHFPEQYTFRKYFKHHVGMSPKEFRLSNVTRE